MEASAVAQAQYYYDVENDKRETLEDKGRANGLNELGDDAFQVSKNLFSIKPQIASPSFVNDKMRLEQRLEHIQARLAAHMNRIKLKTFRKGIG